MKAICSIVVVIAGEMFNTSLYCTGDVEDGENGYFAVESCVPRYPGIAGSWKMRDACLESEVMWMHLTSNLGSWGIGGIIYELPSKTPIHSMRSPRSLDNHADLNMTVIIRV